MNNYQKVLDDTINNLTQKKSLLLHSCCGPCSSYVLNYLNKYFDITIVYYNPNIYPKNEYIKRYNEQKRLIKEMFNDEIEILDCVYDNSIYDDYIKGFESEYEGKQSNRCYLCYKLRLEETAKLAKNNNFDYFGTTLSVSPYKNSDFLNEIGKELDEKYNIRFLYSDFKKKEGYKKSIEYSKKYNLYRQDYCGCKYSIKKA